MCGIAGWWLDEAHNVGASELARMLKAIGHRGPDETGTYIDDKCGIALGHNRLSIIDLTAAGHQPMLNHANGDVLTFNGEIYNYRELRPRLEAEGYRFRSESDTEVLLYALAAWGTECVRHIRGMYAFALWRPTDETLLLFRDPMRIKPLYYWQPPGGGIVFASELKAFLEFPGFHSSVDRRAIGQFLEFGYTFENDRTIINGVYKLPPGHFISIRPNRNLALERYFHPQIASDPAIKSNDVEIELHDALDEVTAQHLIADVPTGLLLSGGLDSSLIAALAARRTEVRTLTMGFAH